MIVEKIICDHCKKEYSSNSLDIIEVRIMTNSSRDLSNHYCKEDCINSEFARLIFNARVLDIIK